MYGENFRAGQKTIKTKRNHVHGDTAYAQTKKRTRYEVSRYSIHMHAYIRKLSIYVYLKTRRTRLGRAKTE